MSDNFYRLYFDPKSPPVVFRQPQMMDNRFKIIIIGDKNVGKSSIFFRMCESEFREGRAENEDSVHKLIEMNLPDKYAAKVDLIDVADSSTLNAKSTDYFRDTSGVVIVYDVTQKETFYGVENHLRQLKSVVPPDCDLLLIGNKLDMVPADGRQVSLEEADKFATSHGISLFEVSAKTGEQVREAFEEFILKIREKGPLGEFDPAAKIMEEPEKRSDTNNNPAPSAGCMWCW